MNKKIKVGIIGVSADRGWASITHVPALKALPEFELTAISNRNHEQAIEAGKRFGVPNTYETTQELVNSDQVNVVAITVKVPQHKELVMAAIEAGKDIYCEWPLGNGLEEAEELTALATKKGITGVVGLQSRAVPAINYIKDLVGQGYVGEVLSTSMIGSGIIYGAMTDEANAYAVDAKNGAV